MDVLQEDMSSTSSGGSAVVDTSPLTTRREHLAHVIRLNVGGTVFHTTRTTLLRHPASLLAGIVREHTGDEIFLDRDGSLFPLVLKYLRDGFIDSIDSNCRRQLLVEARYYNLKGLVELVEPFPSVITLNVGGQIFTTTHETLIREPSSLLAQMFTGKIILKLDSQGNYFIDRDGHSFRHILNYLRDGIIDLPNSRTAAVDLLHQLSREAEYYKLTRLLDLLQNENTGKPLFSQKGLSKMREQHYFE